MWQVLYHMICCSVLHWLMLMPSGWWNCHYMMVHGWCYCQVAERKVLTRCKYPDWAINRVKIKMRTPAQRNKQKNKSCMTGNQKQNYIVVPYYKGLGESLKTTCQKYGVQVYFKGGNTIKSLLMAPKDKDPLMKKSGVIYRYKCDRVMRNI